MWNLFSPACSRIASSRRMACRLLLTVACTVAGGAGGSTNDDDTHAFSVIDGMAHAGDIDGFGHRDG